MSKIPTWGRREKMQALFFRDEIPLTVATESFVAENPIRGRNGRA
jgi:hypothetical protein